jgi:putative SOS response-associated peptidase YedK
MCGRYVASTPTAVLADWFAVDEVALEPDGPSWNVAPTDPVPAVVTRRDGRRRLGVLRWGLVPSWAKDPSGAARMINARSETVLDKPAFRGAFARRRCLLPADGFYEWERPRKRAWFVHAAAGRPLAMAGLWEVWHGPTGEVVRTCSILTTAANAAMRPLHDRMPVFVDPQDWGTWLDPANDDVASLTSLLVPAPDGLLALHPVGPRVNSVRNNAPDLIEPVVP